MKLRKLTHQWIPNLALALGVLLFVRFNLALLAFGLVFVSKWQVWLGGYKLWLSSLRYNACDLVVALSSVLLLLTFAEVPLLQIMVAAFYAVWLIFIKPQSTAVWMAVQALICQFLGLWVVFLYGRILALPISLILSWLIAVIAVDHFFAAYTESARTVLTAVWGLIVAQISWLLLRWLIVYPLFDGNLPIPQGALVITIVSYAFANMYMDHMDKRLHKIRLFEYVALTFGLLILIILGTQWHTRL